MSSLTLSCKAISLLSALFLSFSPLFAQEKPIQDSATIFLEDGSTLFTKVDSTPRFPGGARAWQRYMIKTIRYPQEAQDNNIMG